MNLPLEKIEKALRWRFDLLMLREREGDKTTIEKEIATDWEIISVWIDKQRVQNDLVKKLSTGFPIAGMDYCFYKLGLYDVSSNTPQAEIKERMKSLPEEWENFKFSNKPRLEANIVDAAEFLFKESQNAAMSKVDDTSRKRVVTPYEQQIKKFVESNPNETDQLKVKHAVPSISTHPGETNIESYKTQVFQNAPLPSKIIEKTTEQNTLDNKTVQEVVVPTVVTPTVPQWNYLPVPDGPDKHTEYDARTALSPEGFRIIAARVRGKKHKHEGTNCDDWFEVEMAGPWTIIAVSDGAGSKKLSRVGAKEACRSATKFLSAVLKEHELTQRDIWNVDTFRRDSSGGFGESDIEFVQTAIHGAMRAAYDAVEIKSVELHNSTDHFIYLDNKRPDIKDLSATLLIAIHSTVSFKGCLYSFIMTCQIGDGMIAAINSAGMLQLLAVPDSGDFGGETEFLTSKKKLDTRSLTGKTFPFFSPLRALMVMTDGVADDYFPNDSGMLKLYGDLLLNRIVAIDKPDVEQLSSAFLTTKVISPDNIQSIDLSEMTERVTADNPRPRIRIKSIHKYAEKLGLSLQEVLASPALLWAGSLIEEVEDIVPDEKSLQVWLDSYYNRGSFDDRTLVILYPENLS